MASCALPSPSYVERSCGEKYCAAVMSAVPVRAMMNMSAVAATCRSSTEEGGTGTFSQMTYSLITHHSSLIISRSS